MAALGSGAKPLLARPPGAWQRMWGQSPDGCDPREPPGAAAPSFPQPRPRGSAGAGGPGESAGGPGSPRAFLAPAASARGAPLLPCIPPALRECQPVPAPPAGTSLASPSFSSAAEPGPRPCPLPGAPCPGQGRVRGRGAGAANHGSPQGRYFCGRSSPAPPAGLPGATGSRGRRPPPHIHGSALVPPKMPSFIPKLPLAPDPTSSRPQVVSGPMGRGKQRRGMQG